MLINSVTQENVIDIHNWIPDFEHFLYPEGARPKKAYFPPLEVQEQYIKKDRRYLFKKSSHAPADQFWAEIAAYKIGCMLGVIVPPAYAAYDSSSGECGALVEWFYKDEEHRFIHGAEYMQRVISDYDLDTGAQHNLDTILKICRRLSIKSSDPTNSYFLKTDYVKYWGELIVFDALIGNSDRHQHNWGITVIRENEKSMLEFSPFFDNGTSLGSTRFIHKLDAWPESQFETYVNNGSHHMKFDINSDSRANHIDLISYYLEIHPEIKQHLYHMVAGFCLEFLASEFKKLETLEMPTRLTKERIDYYLKLTAIRQSKILAILI